MIYDDVSDEVKEVSGQVMTLLAMKERAEANERIVEHIKKTEHIYTVRYDEKTEVWIYMDGIYVPQGKTYIMQHCRRILRELYTTHIVNQIISKIETETFINQEDFFKNINKYELAIKNGILNVKTKELTDFTPDKIYFNKIPIIYDIKQECPNIIKFFKSVLRQEEDVKVMQELFGYLLLKDYPINKAFMFSGNGRNGKGITLELMKHFLGPENCINVSIQALESDMYAAGEFFGKLANLAGDIDSKALRKTGLLKSMTTSTDIISASRKFLTKIHFHNYAKMIFCANNIPKTHDESDAFWNRWVFLEFVYMFVSQKEYDLLKEQKTEIEMESIKIADTEIINTLIQDNEMSGLLNWALEGLHRLLRQKDFCFNKSNIDVKNMWTVKSDSLKVFIDKFVEVSYDNKITKDKFREVYYDFCRNNRTKPAKDGYIKSTLIEDIGAVERRGPIDGKTERYWDGIMFKDEF